MSDSEELANVVCFRRALRCNHQWLGSAYSKEIAAQIFVLAKPKSARKNTSASFYKQRSVQKRTRTAGLQLCSVYGAYTQSYT